MVAVAAIAALLGTGLSIGGKIYQGVESRRISFENAELARHAAGDVLAASSLEIFKRRISASRLQGAQRVTQAASGVAVGTGSARAAELDARLAADLDAMVLSNNAAREAWGLQRQATDFERAGRRAIVNAVLGAGGSAIEGAVATHGIMKATGGS